MKILKDGGVTSALGFKAHGLWAGIKRSGKPDLSLITSELPCSAAGVFTKNSIKAAPLIVTKNHLRNLKAQAIICNSGNANCFTGSFGLLYAELTSKLTAERLKITKEDVLVASTGIIGKPMPMDKIASAIPQLVNGLNTQGGHAAAKGILTTDLTTKEIAVKFRVGGEIVTLGACAKGSGMIEPNMATMLAFVTTDAVISGPLLLKALREVTERSFNRITVDGCMSTNDMVLILANGLARNTNITRPGKDYQLFCDALQIVCLNLAKKIVLDGEGATKFIEIEVRGAPSEKIAKKAAMAVANSNLVKTAAYGSNPNWGRVAAAVGSLGQPLTEKDLKISFSPFKQKNIRIVVDLQKGRGQCTVYTADLSPEYIRINGQYT